MSHDDLARELNELVESAGSGDFPDPPIITIVWRRNLRVRI